MILLLKAIQRFVKTNLRLNFVGLIFLGLIYSCNNVSTTENKHSSIKTGKFIDFSPVDFPKNEKEFIHREITRRLAAKETANVFNDSLYFNFHYMEKDFPNNLFLYIVSKEIGESRKVPHINVGDTIQLMRHTIIVDSQTESPNGSSPLVNFKLLFYYCY